MMDMDISYIFQKCISVRMFHQNYIDCRELKIKSDTPTFFFFKCKFETYKFSRVVKKTSQWLLWIKH